MAGRIVVGVDGSLHGRAAARWAAEEALLRDATLVAVHVWSYVPPAPIAEPGLVPMPAVDLPDTLAAQRDVSGSVLESAIDDLYAEFPDLRVEHRLAEGAPAEALCEEAKGADLLVVGTRGHGAVASAFLGSVSHDVARHAPCPVVIVRAHDES